MAKDSNGSNLGFEQKLWQTADKMRNNMDAAEYKHVVLGLIFLKYISDAFKEVHEELKKDKLSDAEDIDEYKSRNVFWVPPEARWDYLQKNAKQPTIGKLIDDAMDAIERDNGTLKATETVLEQANLLCKDWAEINGTSRSAQQYIAEPSNFAVAEKKEEYGR